MWENHSVCKAFRVIRDIIVNILMPVVRILGIYILFCCISVVLLLVAGTVSDVEQVAWIMYNYLHSHYKIYDDIYNYDFNPALGDLLISWILLFPVFITFTFLKMKSIFRRKSNKN